ncbi:MAG: hypothetical protein ACR2OR_17560 [Hyphomicrobiales bacterium]
MIVKTYEDVKDWNEEIKQLETEIAILQKDAGNPNLEELLRDSAKEDIKLHKSKIAELRSQIRDIERERQELKNHFRIACRPY